MPPFKNRGLFKDTNADHVYVNKRNKLSNWEEGYDNYSSMFNRVRYNSGLRRNIQKGLELVSAIRPVIRLPKNVSIIIDPKENSAAAIGNKVMRLSYEVYADVELGTVTVNEADDIFIGEFVHEAAHFLYTDFDVYFGMANNQALTTMPNYKLLKSIQNIIEDEVIERKIGTDFPGYVLYIGKLKRHVYSTKYKEVYEKFLKSGQKQTKVSRYLNVLLDLVRFPENITKEVDDEFYEYLDTLTQILSPFPTDTMGVVEVSKRVYEYIMSLVKEEIEQQQKEQQQQQQKGDKGSGSNTFSLEFDNGDDDEGEGSNSGDEKGNSSDEEDDEGSDNTHTHIKIKAGDGKEENKKSESEKKETLGEFLARAANEAPEIFGDAAQEQSLQSTPTAVLTQEFMETLEAAANNVLSAFGNIDEKNLTKNQSREEVSEMVKMAINSSIDFSSDVNNVTFSVKKFNHYADKSSAMRRYKDAAAVTRNGASVIRESLKFLHKDLKLTIPNMRSGYLNENQIVEAKIGIDTIYKRYGFEKSKKVSIVLLVDESGSMMANDILTKTGNKISRSQCAREVAIMIEQAIKSISVVENYFVYGFTSTTESDEYDNTDVFIYREKGFQAPIEQLGLISSIDCNKDGAAIEAVAKRVRKFTSQPCIYFILSDGKPNGYYYSGDEAERHVLQTVKKVEKMGFLPINIAITSQAADNKKMYPICLDFSNANDIPNKVVKVLQQKLSTLTKGSLQIQ